MAAVPGETKEDTVPERLFQGASCPLVVVGAWQFSAGHSERVDKQVQREAVASLKAHSDAGLYCFDCADIYTGVEALLGEVVQSSLCKIRIHTKCVPDMNAIKGGLVTRDYLEAGVMRSLNRLHVPKLDLVQLHWWDYDAAGFAEAFGSLHSLAKDGLIGAVGLTNTDLEHMKLLAATGHSIASNQVQFSLLDRRPEGSGMVAYCAEHSIELICYGVLAGGFLTDRWLGRADPGFSNLENRSLTKYRLIIDEYGTWGDFQRLLRVIRSIADRRSTTMADVASAWALHKCGSERTRILQGARGAEHAKSMAMSLHIPLLQEEITELDVEIAGRGIRGEVFEAERAGGRHTGVMRQNLNGIGGEPQLQECYARLKVLQREEGATDQVPVTLRREVELLRRLGNEVADLESALDTITSLGPSAKRVRIGVAA